MVERHGRFADTTTAAPVAGGRGRLTDNPRGRFDRSDALVLPVIVAGLVAGGLDIGYVCTCWVVRAGSPPRPILSSVAVGLLGPAAFTEALARHRRPGGARRARRPS